MYCAAPFAPETKLTNIGRIICLNLDENFNISSSQIILEKPYHLSYPYLFEYQGQLYMMPESNENNTIDLYKNLSENYYVEQYLSTSHVNKGEPVLRFFTPASSNTTAF